MSFVKCQLFCKINMTETEEVNYLKMNPEDRL